jgi:hypothetical protein
MPWWFPSRRSRQNWSAEEKTVFLFITITGIAIFLALSIFVYLRIRLGGAPPADAVPTYIFMVLVWFTSFYLARVIWQFLAPTLIKQADANAALRLLKG